MILTKEQLTMSLCELVQSDYKLLNYILIEYVENLTDKQFDDYEDYVNANINELMWGLHHFLTRLVLIRGSIPLLVFNS